MDITKFRPVSQGGLGTDSFTPTQIKQDFTGQACLRADLSLLYTTNKWHHYLV